MAVFGRSFPIRRAVTINRVKSTAAPRLSKLRGLALDGKASGQFTSTNTGTVTLSTTQSNDVIVLFYYGENNNGSGPARTVSSVTSANLTWTLRSAYSMAAGHEQEIWWAIASAPLTNEVITVTVSGVTDGAAMMAFGVSGSNYLTAPWDTNASLASAHALATGTFPSGTVSSSVTFSTDSSTSMVIGFVGTSDNVTWVIPTETYPVFGEVNNASGSRWARQVNFYDEYSSTLSSTTLSVRAPNGGVISFNGLVVDALNGGSLDTLSAGLVTDTDTFFAPTVSHTLLAGLVTDTDAFFVPSLASAITLTPSLFADTDTFFAPFIEITDQTLLPTLIVDTDIFFAPTVTTGSVTLTAGLVTDTDTFFAPAVSAGDVTLTPALVTDTDAFFAPTLSATITLTAGLVTDTDTFFAPTVTAQGGVSPGLVTDTDTFFAPTVVPGSVSILPGLVTDTDLIYAPATDIRNTLTPVLVTDGDSFYAPALSYSITILPDLVSDADVIYAASTPNTSNLTASLVDSDAVIYSPLVSKTGNLLPTLVTDADTLFSPTLVPGPVSLFPSRFIDLDIFWTAFANNVKSNGNGGGSGGGGVPANLKYASQLTMTESGLIFALQVNANAAKSINTRMMVYADNGANLPGALLAQSATKTSVVVGSNNYPLIVPVSRIIGQKVWIALHSDGDFTWFLDTTAGKSKFNTDLFSDGPSDPFGPTSNDNKQAPVFLLFLSSAPIAMSPGIVTDTDTFYAPAISGSKTLLAPFLTDTDFFYSPSVLSAGMVLPSLVIDDDAVYAPSLASSASILPGLVSSDDAIVSPFVARSDHVVFGADVPSDDAFYAPAVTQSGANLHPALYVDADTFYSPFVAAFAPTIFSASVPSDDVFYSPTVSVSGAGLTPALYDDTDLFFSPYVGRALWIIFSAAVPSDDVISQATVTSFGADLPPPLFVDADVFFSPTVVVAGQVGPTLVSDADQFHVPTISSDSVTLVPELVSAGEDFYSPAVSQLLGTHTMTPSLFVDTDVFYSAHRVGHKTGRRQVYLAGRNESNKNLEPAE